MSHNCKARSGNQLLARALALLVYGALVGTCWGAEPKKAEAQAEKTPAPAKQPVAAKEKPAEADKQSAKEKPKVDQHDDAEKRKEDHHDDAATRPTTVTLNGRFTVEEFLKQVGKQTGNTCYLKSDGPKPPQIKANYKNVPFWKAMDDALDQAKLTTFPYNTDKPGLAIVPADPKAAPRKAYATYAGPLRIEATRLNTDRDPRTGEPASLTISLEISWEPRLHPISLTQKAKVLQVVDDTGQDLKLGPQSGRGHDIPPDTLLTNMDLNAESPPRFVKAIASIDGVLEGMVLGDEETFEFPLYGATDKPTVQKRKNLRVTLDSVRNANQLWEARMLVHFDDSFGIKKTSSRGWSVTNDAYLIAKDKSKVDNAGSETTEETENEFGRAYFFDVKGSVAGHTLVYKTPGSMHSFEVHYSVKDLQLP